MNILRWLFIKLWGFEDQKHIEDFITWNGYYLLNRAIKRKRGNARVINNTTNE